MAKRQYNRSYYYSIGGMLTDEEVHQVWEIVGNALDRNGFVDADGELSIRVYDETLKKNVKVLDKSLEWDANTVMEQIHMAESRHMQMGALCSYLLQYPDMTIRNFFAMASEEIREQEEEFGYYE